MPSGMSGQPNVNEKEMKREEKKRKAFSNMRKKMKTKWWKNECGENERTKKKKIWKENENFLFFFQREGTSPFRYVWRYPVLFSPPSFHQYPSSSFYQFPPTPHLLLVLVNQCPTTPWPPPWSFLDGNLSLRLPLQRSSRPQPFRLCVRVSFFFSLSTGPDWQ